MTAPKKGKDLSALKARLAKKTATGDTPEDAAGPPDAAEGAAGDIPAPGEARALDIPAPGEARASIPAPGEARKPLDIPPPGEARRPEPAVAPPKRDTLSDDIYSGGQAFDPNAGVIEDAGGEVKGRSGIGLALFAGLVGMVVGGGLGWMGHKVTDSTMRVDMAKAKAVDIAARIATIEEARAKIALRIGDAEEAITAKDGAKMSEALAELNDEPVDISDLFGWQLALMDPEAVKSFLKLANGYNSMIFQAGFLKALVEMKKDALTAQVGGPANYLVLRVPDSNQVVMAEAVGAICDEIPTPAEGEPPVEPDKLKKCEGDITNATAFLVRTELGGEVAMATADQVSVLVPNGIYTFAIGTNPDKVVVDDVMFRISTLKKLADDLKKNSEKAAEGAAALGDDPKVDG